MFKSTQTQGFGSKAAVGHQLIWISMSWNEAEWILIPSDTSCQSLEKCRCFTPQKMCIKVGACIPAQKQSHVSACCAFSLHCGSSVQWRDKSVGQSTAIAAVLTAMLAMWLHWCFSLDQDCIFLPNLLNIFIACASFCIRGWILSAGVRFCWVKLNWRMFSRSVPNMLRPH